MIKISSVKLNPDHSKNELIAAAAEAAGLVPEDILSVKILKRSVEARKKEPLSLVYTLLIRTDRESSVRAFLKSKKGQSLKKKHTILFVEKEETYLFPVPDAEPGLFAIKERPLIIGSGPAGLLCAYELARHGYRPILAERGMEVEKRTEKARRFWETGELDPECNIQFGEGGAGTFSDGKLNTGVKDRFCRAKEVLELFVRCGADESILYDAKPHVGSDVLYTMVRRIREEILSFGGTFLFGKKAEDLLIKDGKIVGVVFSDGEKLQTGHVVLAIGHSARDTFKMLFEKGVEMQPKAFAVGVRCIQEQEMINRNQWGEDYPKSLGAASYKLTHKAANGRSVYTFCMCPGGYVINASSEEGRLCVNGMSLHERSGKYANSAVIVSVTPQDYTDCGPFDTPAELAGIEYQRRLEERAFAEGNGKIPAQCFHDFLANRVSERIPEDATKGEVSPGDLHAVLPDYICDALADGMAAFERKITGFTDTVLFGVESRTSSPVRIVRDETYQSNIKGLYPCGEGAGYAGGIMSAAMDGIRVAEAVAGSFNSVDLSAI